VLRDSGFVKGPPRILGTHHLAVAVRDLEVSERFYLGVLGLALVVRQRDAAGKHRSTWVTLGGPTFLAIEQAGADQPSRTDDMPGLHCLALQIQRDEREAWRDRLQRHGASVVRESDFTLYTRDPDGILLGLSHYPDPR